MCRQLVTRVPRREPPLRTRLAEETGAEMVEAALVLPILLSLLIGIVWMGLAFNVYQTITHAAREGVRFAIAPTCATCGNTPPTDAEIRAVVTNSLTAAGLDPGNTVPSPLNVQRNWWLNPADGTTDQSCTAVPPTTVGVECGIVISYSYPFQLVIPFTSVHLAIVNIPTRVQMREE